jgi:uncharacterized membrane protein YoaK (UPF0700 family)
MAGGLQDAVTYTLHGQVFATAMTGNLVLMGVALMTHTLTEILRHAIPLCSFGAGVLAGKTLLRCYRPLSLHVTLLLQIAILAIAGAIPYRIPSNLLVMVIAFAGAMQITVVRRADNISFNTTFMTGNLRAVFEGAFDGMFPPPPGSIHTSGGRRQFEVVGLACIGFLAGASLGAASAPRFNDRSFWIAGLLLFTAGLLLRRSDPPLEE